MPDKIPTLTLTPNEPAVEDGALAGVPAGQKPEDIAESLSPEEQAAAEAFSKKIDITDANQVLQYGAAAQQKIGSFSDSALEKIKTKDLGEVGDMMTGLMAQLKGFDVDTEEKGFLGLFKKARSKKEILKARYDSALANVEKVSEALQEHQVTLLKDIALLDKMYDTNLEYFKELTMYLAAGRQKLADVEQNDLAAARKKAEESGRPEDAQAANDLSNLCQRFERKLHDLELTRTISIQMAPQIRLIQNNDSMMAEKIQTSLVNTIPLWKSQMVLGLGLADSQRALEAQRAVTDTTNELLKRNADALKAGTMETAKEAERGIVDIETLQYTNQQLISTLDEVLHIQEEGRQKRAAATAELSRIENELKQKLLAARG